MRLFGKDLMREVALVAEIGVNHEGDVETATRLLRLAAEAGADAVKFQSYTPARFTSANDAARLERVTRFMLDERAHRRLSREADACGVAFFSTAVTEDWVPLLAELGEAIKIASGDLIFEPVVRAAAATGRMVILSTGLGTVEEIDRAVAWVRAELSEAPLPERLVLMHCVSAYPTPVEQANVRSVPFLAERYGLPVGYSNHVIGIEACLAAVALGACVIEAHFTDRREGREFRDHHLSLLPDEFAELARQTPLIKASLGVMDKPVQPCERPLKDAIRKGVVAAHDLAAGAVLTRGNLMFARPASEFPAPEIGELLGRRLKRSLRRGELVARDGVTD
jgi:N-acetylneuraminate synthase/N,N'-diacetyllegionaminate synthase